MGYSQNQNMGGGSRAGGCAGCFSNQNQNGGQSCCSIRLIIVLLAVVSNILIATALALSASSEAWAGDKKFAWIRIPMIIVIAILLAVTVFVVGLEVLPCCNQMQGHPCAGDVENTWGPYAYILCIVLATLGYGLMWNAEMLGAFCDGSSAALKGVNISPYTCAAGDSGSQKTTIIVLLVIGWSIQMWCGWYVIGRLPWMQNCGGGNGGNSYGGGQNQGSNYGQGGGNGQFNELGSRRTKSRSSRHTAGEAELAQATDSSASEEEPLQRASSSKRAKYQDADLEMGRQERRQSRRSSRRG